jgi:hypothetical protein
MGKHDETLRAIFEEPPRKNIAYSRIVALMQNRGCVIREGKGSKVTFIHGMRLFVFHRPHPQKEFQAYNVVRLRSFLLECGISPLNDQN